MPILLSHIVESDKRVARATHPIINAWVCRTPDGVFHHGKATRTMGVCRRLPSTDCDDDGETAAGGRLAHLLSMLVCMHAWRQAHLADMMSRLECRKCPGRCHALVWRRAAGTRPVQANQSCGPGRVGKVGRASCKRGRVRRARQTLALRPANARLSPVAGSPF